jgi:hypothetical protein
MRCEILLKKRELAHQPAVAAPVEAGIGARVDREVAVSAALDHD